MRQLNPVQTLLTDNTVIHIGCDDQISFRNLHGHMINFQIGCIAGGQDPRAFRSQLPHTDGTRRTECHKNLRTAHEQNSCAAAIKFFGQEYIAQPLTAVEARIIKFIQCFRNRQRQQSCIHAERIA